MRTDITFIGFKNRSKVTAKSGHQNIIKLKNGNYIVSAGSNRFPRQYTQDEIPLAVEFRDRHREKAGYPKAEY